MIESVTDNVEEVYESDNQVDRINSLIKEFMTLREATNRYKENRYYWGRQVSALSTNIWVGKTRENEFQKLNAGLRTAISEAMGTVDLTEPEFNYLLTKRVEEWSQRCDDFQAETTNCARNFLSAQTEYSIENLMKNIEEYRRESKKVNDEITTIKRKLEDMETRCGLNCLNMCKDVEDVSKINTILNDVKLNDGNQLRSTKDTLQAIKTDIKQKKIVLDGFKFIKPMAL